MKRLLAAAVVALAPLAATAAHAADYNWSGPYVGAAVGMTSYTSNNTEGYDYAYYTENYQSAGLGLTGNLNIGYNFQTGPWVYGAEVDFSAMNKADGGYKYFEAGYGGYDFYKDSINSAWTARVRAGYAFGRTLIYLTGGYARGSISHNYTYDGSSIYNYNISGGKDGFVVGAGGEHAITSHIIVTGQVAYIDLGSSTTSTDGAYYTYKFVDTATVSTIGLKYKF